MINFHIKIITECINADILSFLKDSNNTVSNMYKNEQLSRTSYSNIQQASLSIIIYHSSLLINKSFTFIPITPAFYYKIEHNNYGSLKIIHVTPSSYSKINSNSCSHSADSNKTQCSLHNSR